MRERRTPAPKAPGSNIEHRSNNIDKASVADANTGSGSEQLRLFTVEPGCVR